MTGDTVVVVAVSDGAQPRSYSVRFLDGRAATIPATDLSVPPSSRLYCPVPGCPAGDARLCDGWLSLATLKGHLDACHCSRPEAGRIPDEWLRDHGRILCPECGLLCSASRQCCRRCWPARRAAAGGADAVDTTRGDLPELGDVHAADIPTLKHVPQKARVRWARALRVALGRLEAEHTLAAVVELQMLPKCVLCLPPSGRGGRKHRGQVAGYTLSRLERWERGERATLFQDAPRARRPSGARSAADAAAVRAERAEQYAREGLWSKAAAALLDVGVADPSAGTRADLARLHPAALAPVPGPSPAGAAPPPRVSAACVLEQVRAFPKGTAPGPSGMRAQHLLDALVPGDEDALSEHLSRLVTWLAAGSAPSTAAPHLAGARLIALLKPDGRLRPIAVGEVLRRLTGRCLCAVVRSSARSALWPLQTGVAVPMGIDSAVHSLRRWSARAAGQPGHVALKLDFRNAFNCISRASVLEQVRAKFPQLLPWVRWCYCQTSDLLFGATEPLDSAEGVQQGDPLGPLLFALGIHPLVERLSALRHAGVGLDLVQFYLDDGVLAGPAELVADALAIVQRDAAGLGLDLNLAKCELVVPSGLLSASQCALFPASLRYADDGAPRVILSRDFDYLGSPIGCPAHCDAFISRRVAKVRAILAAVNTIADPEVAFKVAKSCVNYGRVMHLMRTVPFSGAMSSFASFDDAVAESFSDITGVFPTEEQWSRATRGVSAGGCGLRSAQRHWPAAFLASSLATRAACRALDPAGSAGTGCVLHGLLPHPAAGLVAEFCGYAVCG